MVSWYYRLCMTISQVILEFTYIFKLKFSVFYLCAYFVDVCEFPDCWAQLKNSGYVICYIMKDLLLHSWRNEVGHRNCSFPDLLLIVSLFRAYKTSEPTDCSIVHYHWCKRRKFYTFIHAKLVFWFKLNTFNTERIVTDSFILGVFFTLQAQWVEKKIHYWGTVWGPAILTEGFRSFLQSFKANAGVVPQMRPRPFPFICFPIRYPLIIL